MQSDRENTEQRSGGGLIRQKKASEEWFCLFWCALENLFWLTFTYEIRKGGMDNTQKNCGFTDVVKARVQNLK